MEVTRIHQPPWARELYRPHEFKVIYGGRASGKTWAICTALAVQMHQSNIRVVVAREHLASIRKSAKPELEDAIVRARIKGDFLFLRDRIVCARTGSECWFISLSTASEEDIRGLSGIDRCWVEEAHRMSHSSWGLLKRTIRKDGSEIWFTFNPKNRYDPVYKDFVLKKNPRAWVHKVNYTENPWFPDRSERDRLDDLRDDPQMYAHWWLGETDDASAERKVLPYAMLQKCVDAWDRRPPADGLVHAGLDVADTGADRNAYAARRMAELFHVERWSAKTVGETARRVDQLCIANAAARLYFDAGGPGSGVRSHLIDMEARSYAWNAVHFGGKVLAEEVTFIRGVTNKQYFFNRAAQMGWGVRIRANFTIRLLDGDAVPLDRCLFINPAIPRLEDIMAQCAQPEWQDDTGKLRIKKQPHEPLQPKPPSPDSYDATILAFSADAKKGLRRPT